MAKPLVILVAEDDVVVRNYVRHTLEDAEFRVLTAANGVEALAISRGFHERIDVLLTDVEMPHLDGLALLQHIREERPQTAVVVMSGSPLQTDRINVAPNFILKPFTPRDLISIVEKSLGEAARDSAPENQSETRYEGMASPDHLAALKSGARHWDEWRSKNRFMAPDLNGADLSAANLSGVDLRATSLRTANLNGVNLSEANLGKADLGGADLIGAYLIKTDLKAASLIKADLTGVDLFKADLNGANLSGAYLVAANLNGANFSGANLSGAYLIAASLSGANLSGALLAGASLGRTDLSGAYLIKADLIKANLVKANLCGADLVNADLSEANLSGADLSAANLNGTNLTKANLCRTNLSRANLNGANLAGANLSGADLRGANLVKANLNGANLGGANLSAADLSWAKLNGAYLTAAILTGTHLDRADLTGASVFGISAWNLSLEGTVQKNLIVQGECGDGAVTLDGLELAQFMHLLLHNQHIRDVIDTITSKAVLILGHFPPDRNAILEGLRDELRRRNYLPILFDFRKPAELVVTETVSTLAHMARFVIADLTKSPPDELTHLVPLFSSIPVQPILMAADREWPIFEDMAGYPWVLPTARYPTQEALLAAIPTEIVDPAERKSREQTKPS